MPGLKYDHFLGLQPRVPASLLPQNAATVATNCDFAYGELRNVRGDMFLKTMANSAASLYTDNGLTFYSWPEEVNAVRSPLANDQYDRLYYTTPTDFRVTTRSTMTIAGGVPPSSYRVGVPRPTTAPTLAIASVSALADTELTATFHYEYSGVKYQEQVMALTVVTALSKWTYTPPASNYVAPVKDAKTGELAPLNPALTPAQAIPVLRLTARDRKNGTVVLDVYTSNSSLGSNAGWTLAAAKTGTAGAYTVTLAIDEDEADKETRAYVFTLVNTYNEEGPPSPPATITLNMLLHVDMKIKLDAFSIDYAPLKEIRVYRTPSGSAEADYYFAGAIPVLGLAAQDVLYTDKTAAGELNEALSSLHNYPPDPLLSGLMTLPNGILMAWKGNQIHFSDAYRPWSWPPQYVRTLPDTQVIGAAVIGSGALLTTTTKPYIVSGISPDSMSEAEIKVHQAGVSKWSVIELGGSILYASHDGLVAIIGNQPSLEMSQRFFTREVWREKYAAGLDTMRFAVWDGRLIVYSSAKQFTPFMISMDEGGGQMTELPALKADCSFTSPLSDQCYYVLGNALYQFAGGADAKAVWTSREELLPRLLNMGAAEAITTGTWTIKIYADGALKHTREITGSQQFRLPSGFLSDRWTVSVEGTGRFREFRIATTIEELKKL